MSDSERERFEATISAPPFECNVERYPESTNVAWPGCYIDMAVDLAWDMWQAALADRAPAQAQRAEPVAWYALLHGGFAHVVWGNRPDTEMGWLPLYAAPRTESAASAEAHERAFLVQRVKIVQRAIDAEKTNAALLAALSARLKAAESDSARLSHVENNPHILDSFGFHERVNFRAAIDAAIAKDSHE